jgi:hypothetical protein
MGRERGSGRIWGMGKIFSPFFVLFIPVVCPKTNTYPVSATATFISYYNNPKNILTACSWTHIITTAFLSQMSIIP